VRRFFFGLLPLLSLPLVSLASPAMLIPARFSDLPGWKTDDHRGSLLAFKNSCIALIHKPEYRSVCQQANQYPLSVSNSTATLFFEEHFKPYEMLDPDTHSPKGLFTGYYEPSYPASFTPTDTFNVPIYGKPYHYREAMNGQGLPPRESIAHGKAGDFAPILAYVKSRVDRFFLQIQGSGMLVFPDGETMLLGYAGENGHPYEPIGRDLIAMGEIPKKNISMQSIQSWLYNHPARVDEILNLDPSFVFFRKVDRSEPLGAEGVELTPFNSIAVDTQFTSLGTPVFISTYYPKLIHHQITPGKPLQHLFIAQDVGGAIKNPVRADIFFGPGTESEWMAGHMQSIGKMWILKLRKDN
jgi:membrane-bound lytic murein transglycosylase A